jgi:hypothetical protein
MSEQNATMMVSFDILAAQVDQLAMMVEVLAGQRSTTRTRNATHSLLNTSDQAALTQKIAELRKTIMDLAGQRSTT